MSFPFKCLGAFLALSLCACGPPPRPTGPIPVQEVPAPLAAASHPLMIVLPGRGDDLKDLAGSGIAQAIQSSWPEPDVLLAGATLGYYSDGRLAERLHDEVIMPARAAGHREIWLCGASMGGMGALLYEQRYPGDVAGLVLFAPYLGEAKLVDQVAAAGGPAHWDAGPVPTKVDGDNYQHELWRLVQGWQDPRQARRIWLSGGDSDRFVQSTRMVATLLPPTHYVEVPGGHDWPEWDAGARVIFLRITAEHSH